MKRTLPLALSLLIGASLAACAPGTLTWPALDGSRSPVAPVKGHTAVTFRIVPTAGFKTKDAPGQATGRVDHFTVTLKQNGVTVVMAGNPANVALPAPANQTFNNVPAGTNYTLVADAVDANGASVTTGAATSAAFDITAAGAIVDTGTANAAANPIALAITYAAGALDPGPTVRVTGGVGGVEKAGISLLNLLTFKTASAAAKDVSTSPTDFTISNVAQGATTGNSHRLFYYFADNIGGAQATVAKSQFVPGSTSGKIDTTQINLAHSMVQAPVDTATNNATPDVIHTGGLGHTYFYNAGPGNFLREDNTPIDISNGGVAIPVLPIQAFTVTPISGHDTIFYFDRDDNKIKKNDDQGMISPSDVLDLTGNVTAVTDIAADAGGAVYWLDAGNVYKLPANIVGPTFASATQIVGTGTVTGIAVDAFGTLYYAIGNQIFRSTLGTANGTNYAAGVLKVNAINPVVSLSADAVGDVYYQDGNAADNLLVWPAGGNAIYHVVGTKTVTVKFPSVGADGTLYYIDNTGGGVQGHTMKL